MATLYDQVLAIQQQKTNVVGTTAPSGRIYSSGTIDPNHLQDFLAVVEETYPGEFKVHGKAMLKSTPVSGAPSCIASLKAPKPNSRTISVYHNGNIAGDGIDVAPLLIALVDRLAKPAKPAKPAKDPQ